MLNHTVALRRCHMDRFGVCVALVVGLHAGLLALPVRSSVPKAVVSVMQVRLLPRAAFPIALPIGQAQQAAAAKTASPTDETLVASRSPGPTFEPEPEADAPDEGLIAEPAAPVAPAVFFPRIDPDEGFLPRSMLSETPSPTGPVILDFPEFNGEQARYVSELLLFIDEFGQVVRVRVDGPELPPELEEAARSAFLAARFEAGQIEGRAVRSRIRVEVSFDSGVAKR